MHSPFDAPGNRLRPLTARQPRRQLAECLVNRDLLQRQHGVFENCHHTAGEFAIAVKSRAQKDRLGTEASRMGGGHRAADAIAAGGIVRRADHPAPFRVAADDHRLTPQRGIIKLLGRGEEAIEVGMEHPAESPGWNHHVRCPRHPLQLNASLCLVVYRVKNKWSSSCVANCCGYVRKCPGVAGVTWYNEVAPRWNGATA